MKEKAHILEENCARACICQKKAVNLQANCKYIQNLIY